MKLSASLVVLSIVFGVNCAVAPDRPRHHGGSSHRTAIASARPSNNVNRKHHHRSISSARSRNGTSDFLRHPSSMDFYANSTDSTSVAPQRSESTPTKVHRRYKRGLSSTGDHGSSSLKASTHMHGEVDSASRTAPGAGNAQVKSSIKTKIEKRSPENAQSLNLAPTPAPTSSGSSDTIVHINDENDFALLLPKNPGELISDAEVDGIAFCTTDGCSNTLPGGFITAAAVTRAPDNSSWIQVTGCINPTKTTLSTSDDGGQFDVRFPNGAQCSFGGYGASFIEQVEPSANRFCLRCCANENDQTNCNSHQDRAGCPIAIPGVYDFPDKGVSCA